MSVATHDTTPRSNWEADAACSNAEWEELFGVEGERAAERHVREAQTIAKYCVGCSVRTECLDVALAERKREGVWGGTAQADRRAYFNEKLEYGELVERGNALAQSVIPKQRPPAERPKLVPLPRMSPENAEVPVQPTGHEPTLQPTTLLAPVKITETKQRPQQSVAGKAEKPLKLDELTPPSPAIKLPRPNMRSREVVETVLGDNHDENAAQLAIFAQNLTNRLQAVESPRLSESDKRMMVFLLKGEKYLADAALALEETSRNRSLQKIQDTLSTFVARHTGYIGKLIPMFAEVASSMTEDDFMVEGMQGLVEGMRKFDLFTLDTKVLTFCYRRIWGAMADEKRDTDNFIRVSRHDWELRKALEKGEIQDPDELLDAQAAVTRIDRSRVSSIHNLVATSDGRSRILSDRSSADQQEQLVDRLAETQALRLAVSRLTVRDRALVELYYGLNGHPGINLRQVGEQLGFTESRASQIAKKTLATLRTEIELILAS